MSGAELVGRPVWSTKCNRNIELAPRHHEHVGRIVYNLIEGDQRETKRHEFDDGSQSSHGRADSKTGESVFADWRIDNSLGSEAFQQSLADFVSAVIFRHLFAHQKNIRIALELFSERFIQGLTVSDFPHDFLSSE